MNKLLRQALSAFLLIISGCGGSLAGYLVGRGIALLIGYAIMGGDYDNFALNLLTVIASIVGFFSGVLWYAERSL